MFVGGRGGAAALTDLAIEQVLDGAVCLEIGKPLCPTFLASPRTPGQFLRLIEGKNAGGQTAGNDPIGEKYDEPALLGRAHNRYRIR